MRAHWVAVLAASACLAAPALAAQSPFGISTPDTGGGAFGGPLAPVFAWIAAHQAAFYRSLTETLSEVDRNGTAVWLLLGLSFLYGIFHAAGPGHGKAVITSYVVASGESARRGIAISFAAAFVQAVSAVVVVGIAAAILNVTAQTMTLATDWLEIGSYGLIVLVGVWLLWSKGFRGGHAHCNHHHLPGEDGHAHHHHDGHDHHHHDHDHGAKARPDRPRNPLVRAWSAIVSVGIRPCSGAIIILVFALSQGLFAAGIAATFVMALGTGITVAALATLAVSAKGLALRFAGAESSAGVWVLRVFEVGAAALVLLLGLLLLGGALSYRLGG
ncbi:nickel/cobalt transporter [Bauldia sp.]|uniref:nickel/cobalt transporter n=1 Tax=Bauldia sp. TaxID=2575872 RepID=UPI003BAA86BB